MSNYTTYSKRRKNPDWIIFLISPVLCFIRIFFQIRKNNYRDLCIVPFIMGMFAYLFPLYSDLARNINGVNEQLSFDWSEFLLLNVDFLLPVSIRLFLVNHIPLEILRFSYTFLVYYQMYFIVKKCLIKEMFKQDDIKSVWLILFLYIPFFALVTNTRMSIVIFSLFTIAFQVFILNNNKALWWLILLPFVHFASIPAVILFLFAVFLKLSLLAKAKKVLLVTFVILLLIPDNSFILNILSTLPLGDALLNKIQIYTEGEWGAGGDLTESMQTANYKIYAFICSVPYYYLLWIFWKSKSIYRIDNFIFLLLGFLVFIAPIPVFFGRYSSMLESFLLFRFLMEFKERKITNNQIRVLISLYIISTACNVYANYNCLVNGNIFYLATPVPLEVCQTYDLESWCKYHLTSDYNSFINKSLLSR